MVKKLLILSLLLFTTVFGQPAYEIDKLNIVANIERDGSLEVEERVTYDIGRINGILYNIDMLGYGELEDLKIFYEEGGEFISAKYSSVGRDGDYTLDIDDGVYKIKLYVPGEREKKDFIFRYKLSKGVTVYQDIAQLNRKMVGTEWQNSIDSIKVEVNLPESVDKSKIYAFGHGPLTGNIKIVDGSSVEYTLDNYSPGEFLEVNLLFPKEILTDFNPNNILNKNGLESILEMERKLAKEANKTRNIALIKYYLKWIILGVGIAWEVFLLSLIYKKNGKRHKVENRYGEYFRELPDDYSPALAGMLVSGKIYPGTRELFASLLELVRKDCLRLEEENGQTIFYLEEESKAVLSSEEKFLLNWYIRDLGDGEKVVLEELKKISKNKSQARRFNENFERWKTMVYSDMLSKNLKMDKPSIYMILLGVLSGGAYIFLGLILEIVFKISLLKIFAIMGGVFIFLTLSIKRPSLEKEMAISRWSAFRKFLIDYSNLEDAQLNSLELWEHYFVYAVAMGVSERVAKIYESLLAKKSEEDELDRERRRRYRHHRNLFYTVSHRDTFVIFDRSVGNIRSAAVERVAKSSRSSYSGRGGGFSGGSSGGGGGRSGGGAF